MRSFLYEYVRVFRTALPYVVWFVLTAVASISGPFGNHDTPLGTQAPVWAGAFAVAVAVWVSVRLLVRTVLRVRDRRAAALLTGGLSALLVAPPLDIVLHWNCWADLPHLPGLAELMFLIFAVSAGAEALHDGASADTSAGNAPPEPEAPLPTLPRLVQRLPQDLRGELLSISVRDHYVDVRTDKGTGSLLMRLSDAMAEADTVDGAQIHRSHWVAWAAVDRGERAGGKLFLVLRDGARVPVSRNHKDKVAARGLI